MKIIDFLFSIEHKLPLYIGNEDILAFRHFIDGYCTCAMNNGIDCGEKVLFAFNDYVCNLYNFGLNVSAYRRIKLVTTTNEEASIFTTNCFIGFATMYCNATK